ncbi:hypothetical protein GH733_011901 [Mirounga leonina]|nr:hypothetical protein GH733_011901 [Mirounga leonina]
MQQEIGASREKNKQVFLSTEVMEDAQYLPSSCLAAREISVMSPSGISVTSGERTEYYKKFVFLANSSKCTKLSSGNSGVQGIYQKVKGLMNDNWLRLSHLGAIFKNSKTGKMDNIQAGVLMEVI